MGGELRDGDGKTGIAAEPEPNTPVDLLPAHHSVKDRLPFRDSLTDLLGTEGAHDCEGIPSRSSDSTGPPASRESLLFKTTPSLCRGPRADTADALYGDARYVAGRRIGERRELHARTKVGVREPLEQLGCATLRHASSPVDDKVMIQTHVVLGAGLNRQRHAGITADIAHLVPGSEMGTHDLVTLDPGPHDGDLGTAIRVEGHEMRELARRESRSDRLGESCHDVPLLLQFGQVSRTSVTEAAPTRQPRQRPGSAPSAAA